MHFWMGEKLRAGILNSFPTSHFSIQCSQDLPIQVASLTIPTWKVPDAFDNTPPESCQTKNSWETVFSQKTATIIFCSKLQLSEATFVLFEKSLYQWLQISSVFLSLASNSLILFQIGLSGEGIYDRGRGFCCRKMAVSGMWRVPLVALCHKRQRYYPYFPYLSYFLCL